MPLLASAFNTPEIYLPRHRLLAEEIGVIINDEDPLSVRIANYYQQVRKIPASNLIHVSFKPGSRTLAPDLFSNIRNQAKSQFSTSIQALALTWALPYRVGCMSITSAFTFGFDKAYCSSRTCAATRISPYFNSKSTMPYSDFRIRPTMALAAVNFKLAKQLIDRGLRADKRNPEGTAYLLHTSDKNRNVRARFFKRIKRLFSPLFNIEILHRNSIQSRHDVMFYFTGLTKIPHLDTLSFLPGAVADHLTSAGGVLDGRKQMSALRWLEAGATGSYGTVVEPCNLLGKFPKPGLMMENYMSGQTLIEAYWKSVQQPGEGLFIGEPLAAPFDGIQIETNANEIIMDTHSIQPGMYKILSAPTPVGPYRIQAKPLIVKPLQTRIKLPKMSDGYYRIEALK
jgi:uncharacterized protein (TIGR03790 family)